MKRKILLISESMGGGLRKHIVQLINNLDQNKFDLYLIHGTKNLDQIFLDEYESLSTRCHLIPCTFFEREIIVQQDLKVYQFLLRKMKEIQPDIVHCHSSKAGVIGRLAAKKNRIEKIFYTPHAYSFLAPEFSGLKKRVFIFIERFVSRYATVKTFCVSRGELDAALEAKIDKLSKFKVIYNGLSNESLPTKNEARKVLKLPQKAFIVGNNARISEQKNPRTFLEIAKKVLEEEPETIFSWIGDGPLRNEIEENLKDYDLKENIKFLGFHENSDKLVVAYDVFLFTSLYEGFPYAPIEALRAKIPVIATDVTGTEEIVVDRKNGYLLKNDFVDEAVDIILNYIRGKNTLNKELIRKSFEENFSLDLMIKKIEKEYCK